MIRFDGALTGDAKEHFMKKMINKACIFGFLASLFNIPFWGWLFSVIGKAKYGIPLVIVLCALFPLLIKLLVPQKSKERANIRKVIIKDDIITIISEESSTKKNIKRVKKVRDYGEFYELVFSPIDLLSVCVCQKSLLSKGSIKEFEELFSDKLIKQDHSDGSMIDS